MGQRILVERAISGAIPADRPAQRRGQRPVRSVTVNLADSPLGWLLVRGHVTRRQFDAGEALRTDFERARFEGHTTMRWECAPLGGLGPSGPAGFDLSAAQIDARRRFDQAVAAAGPGLADILWRVACAGEGMREAETALGWPARSGKLVLRLALDRVADFYRVR